MLKSGHELPAAEDTSCEAAIGDPASRARRKGKRGPGRTSCAECHRAKLKCDGKEPCQQCVKRGCGDVCPEGITAPRRLKAHRNLLETTSSALGAKIAIYKQRIKDLEEALRSAYSVVSTEPHPLLSEDLLRVKDDGRAPSDNELRRAATFRPINPSTDQDIADRFGSLSISHDGTSSKFFGHAANGYMMMQNKEMPGVSDIPSLPALGLRDILPPELLLQTGTSLAELSGGPTLTTSYHDLELLVNLLPPEATASCFTDNAYRYGFPLFHPLPIAEYRSGIYEPLYRNAIQLDHPLLSVRLAVMYALLSYGAQNGIPHSPDEAELYLHLCRAAMVHARVVESPTIEGVQALFIFSLCLSLMETASSDKSNLRWATSGLMIRIGHIIGLHSDPSRYNLGPVETKRRRLLFTELYMYDLIESLMYSRPAGISLGQYDVKPHSLADDEVEPQSHYHQWKYRYALECLAPVEAQASAQDRPSYETVLSLSKNVESFMGYAPPPGSGITTVASRTNKEDILLHLHRPFCLIALEKHKEDPLSCDYGYSVKAAYQSAQRIIAYIGGLFTSQECPGPVNRAWHVWTRVYGAATIIGTMIIRCPHLPFAVEAYQQLRTACVMLYALRESLQAEGVYDKLMATLDLAHRILSAHQNNLSPTVFPDNHDVEALLAELGTKPQVTIWPVPDVHSGQEKGLVPLLFSTTAPHQPEHQPLDPDLLQMLQAVPNHSSTSVLPSPTPELSITNESIFNQTCHPEFDMLGWSSFGDLAVGLDGPLKPSLDVAGTMWTNTLPSPVHEFAIAR